MKRAVLVLVVLGCGSSKVPKYDDALKAQISKVATCKSFPQNRSGSIKDSYTCNGDGVELLVNVTTHERLWFIQMDVMAPNVATAKPKVEAVFTGIVGADVIQEIGTHLDDAIAKGTDGQRREVGGVGLSVGSTSFGDARRYHVEVSWSGR